MAVSLGSERWSARAVVSALLLGVIFAVTVFIAPDLTARGVRSTAHPPVMSLRAQTLLSGKVGASDPEFAARRAQDGYALSGGGVSAVLGRSGARISGNGSVSMTLAAVGRGARFTRVGAAVVTAHGNRVAYRYRGVSTWYSAGPLGVEQGFTVLRRPAGAGAPLTLALDLGGSLAARQTHSGVEFLARSGRLGLRYGGLEAVDASGRKLPASLELSHGRLLLRVRDQGARYPVRIDPLFQLGAKLTGPGEVGAGVFGGAVALSADGNTALIGGPDSSSQVGAAWIFVRNGSTWTEQAKLTGSGESGAAYFGSSMALSGDGDTAVIGGELNDSGVGAAWVFTRSGTTWTQQAKLAGSGESGDADFGFSVALSSAGTTALVGGPSNDSDVGAAWVFTLSGSTWGTGHELIPSNPTGSSAFGVSVGLSGAGTTALVGGDDDNSDVGAAWVFTGSGTSWTQGPKLTGGSETGAGSFGASVALSTDASTALIGGDTNNSNAGAAWVFTGSGSSWTQQAKLTPNDETGDGHFGFGLALTSNGNTALIGGYTDSSGVGAAWQYTRSGSTWTQQGDKLLASDEAGEGDFGFGASLSSDGNTALIGAPYDNGYTGAAWIFENAPPVCANTAAATAVGGGTVTLALQCSNPFGLPLTYGIVNAPSHGLVGAINQATGTVSYTPYLGYTGTDQFTYDATGADGASNIVTATIVIPPAPRPLTRLNTTIDYTFHATRRYTVFEALYVSGVPSAARVEISCQGRHCPFKAHTERVPRRRVCKGKGKHRHCVKKPPPRVGTVTLTSLFHHRHLAVGAKLTISVVQSGAIGKVYSFKIRRSRAPSLKVACLAPGSSTPGRGC